MKLTAVYYEPECLDYPLGQNLKEQFKELPWVPIESHNSIPEMQQRPNSDFGKMKQCLIIGTRKTHKYTPNGKISNYLVPFTSSGCTAMCTYCYLVCNYNKCAYLRLFVNREQMLERLVKFSIRQETPGVFEIGANSDLVLENTLTHNLEWVIPTFANNGRGMLTFPTKFHMIEPLLGLHHGGKTLFRMSVNPTLIILRFEFGTSDLAQRIWAVNQMAEAGYPVGLLIAPVILVEGWKSMYAELIDLLALQLSETAKKNLKIEIILMTYSYVHRMILQDAFPNATDPFNPALMTGRGRGRYCYRPELRLETETFFRQQIQEKLPQAVIAYFS